MGGPTLIPPALTGVSGLFADAGNTENYAEPDNSKSDIAFKQCSLAKEQSWT